MELKQIGTIKNKQNNYQVQIDKLYWKALKGIEGFSHCIILWWADKCDSPDARKILECTKPYTKGPETLGIFSTRSPARPNPICSSVVSILSIDEQGTITVPYIDADDNTPVLDIKPYHPSADRIMAVSLPTWCEHWPQSIEESASFHWEEEFNF
jgi:tRNA-Thr(GGU) m(6)t(6)A37 methyltransferase TsaA